MFCVHPAPFLGFAEARIKKMRTVRVVVITLKCHWETRFRKLIVVIFLDPLVRLVRMMVITSSGVGKWDFGSCPCLFSSRFTDAISTLLISCTSCPYMVHKTWRRFVQPINVVFLLNFREVTCHIWNLFIRWQLINIQNWAEARWFVVGSNRGAPKLLRLPSATAWWTRDQPEREFGWPRYRRSCRKATWLSHG